MAPFPAPETGILLTHFIVVGGHRSLARLLRQCPRRRSRLRKPRGSRAREQLDHHEHGRWFPTDDKPAVTLTASDPDTTSGFPDL